MALSKKDLIGLWIMGVATAVIVAVVAITYNINRTKNAEAAGVDSVSLCAISENYRHTIVLVDKTDPFSATQKAFFLAKVRELKATLELGERLSIYIVDDSNYRAPQPALSMCNPGSERNANPLIQNPRQMQQKFDQAFGKPLDEVAHQMVALTTTTTSPIVEMIYSISQLHDFGPRQPYRRLVIFSDLMQNSKEFSHFKEVPLWNNFKNSAYAKDNLPSLQGVNVEVVYLLRPAVFATQKSSVHQEFWRGLFEGAGVISIDFRRIG